MSNIDSVYIHIPFCKTICSYCDFCKIFYDKKYIKDYLDSLAQEIKTYYKDHIIKTIYIGGGTPSSLSIEELNRLFEIIRTFKLAEDFEFTFEINIEHINEEILALLYQNKVNRLSIGVQTFNPKHLQFLNRNHQKEEVIKNINIAKGLGFTNINIDLIYAIPNQTKEELLDDINMFLKLDVNHISTYSLIIEPRTILYVNKVEYIDDELDYAMYKIINDKLTQHGFNQYEISNYSKPGYESKHNLQYWNNSEYYGFGMGASGYVNNIRYTNTLNINKYIKNCFRDLEEVVDSNTKLENEFLLGFRKTKGINKQEFYQKYGITIYEIPQIYKLIKEGKLIDKKTNIFINPKYLYLSNEILINFMV